MRRANASDGAGDVEVTQTPGLPGEQPAQTQGHTVSQDGGPPPKPARGESKIVKYIMVSLCNDFHADFYENMVIMSLHKSKLKSIP